MLCVLAEAASENNTTTSLSLEDVGKKVSLAIQEAKRTSSIVYTGVNMSSVAEDSPKEIVKGIPLEALSKSKFTSTAGALGKLGPWHWDISFNNGVPVGGYADLVLLSDGSYTFSGHFHDSGAPSYNVAIAWVVKSSSGIGFSFTSSGHLAGTFEPGSRDHDWSNSGVNQAISNEWNKLQSGWEYQARAGANIDVGAILGAVVKAIGIVNTVVAVV